jgi:hypothetical protein
MQNFVQRPPNKGMIDFEENMDPNAIIKANTVKLNHPAHEHPAKLATKAHAPAPLVSEPVEPHHQQHTTSK